MENARLQKRLAGEDDVKPIYPKNSYSGLNSLRARLSLSGSPNIQDSNMDSESWKADGNGKNEGLTDGDDCTNQIRIGLGEPVYFFFQINSASDVPTI